MGQTAKQAMPWARREARSDLSGPFPSEVPRAADDEGDGAGRVPFRQCAKKAITDWATEQGLALRHPLTPPSHFPCGTFAPSCCRAAPTSIPHAPLSRPFTSNAGIPHIPLLQESRTSPCCKNRARPPPTGIVHVPHLYIRPFTCRTRAPPQTLTPRGNQLSAAPSLAAVACCGARDVRAYRHSSARGQRNEFGCSAPTSATQGTVP